MMTSAQVVKTLVNVTSNSPSQDYTHPDDHNLPNYEMTPGFKPFTVSPIYQTLVMNSETVKSFSGTIAFYERHGAVFGLWKIFCFLFCTRCTLEKSSMAVTSQENDLAGLLSRILRGDPGKHGAVLGLRKILSFLSTNLNCTLQKSFVTEASQEFDLSVPNTPLLGDLDLFVLF